MQSDNTIDVAVLLARNSALFIHWHVFGEIAI